MSWFTRFVVVLLLVTGFASSNAEAQYTVQHGDNLWELAGKNLDSASAWEKIYQENRFLQEPGRRFEIDGRTIVVIRPGEVLQGLDKLGIVQEESDIIPDVLEKSRTIREVITMSEWPWWFWWLLVALTALIIWLIMRHNRTRDRMATVNQRLRERNENLVARQDYEHMLNMDPVGSGEPIFPAGVTDATAPARFQEMAAHRWEAQTGRTANTQVFTIQRLTAGRGWGLMNVSYADGSTLLRRLNGERVYEADVLFPDGNVETLYMLQGCGNDLRYGGVHRYNGAEGFRFVPDTTMAPTMPTTATAPATTSTNVVQAQAVPSTTEAIKDGLLRLEVRLPSDNGPSMIKLTGVRQHSGVTIDASGDMNEVTVRVYPRK